MSLERWTENGWLGNGGLGNRQMVDDVPGDAPGMGHQKLYNFKANGIADGLEHIYQPFLGLTGNIQCTTLGRYPGHELIHDSCAY